MLLDTHTHTNYSDGLDDLKTVVSKAASMKMSLMSITDHDRVMAYPEAIRLGERYGIKMIPGVEITTKDEDDCSCVHIVGLGIDTGSHVASVLERSVKAQEDANRGFLDNMNAFMARKYAGWISTESMKPSIFHNTIINARNQGIEITEKEMMDVILNRDLWVPIEFEITIEEAVSYIKNWGGVPVLAHPFDFSNNPSVLLKRFVSAGGEAVEICKYRYKVRTAALSKVPKEELLIKEREMNLWTIEQAKKHGLKITMASDRHDDSRVMGMDPDEYEIDTAWLYEL